MKVWLSRNAGRLAARTLILVLVLALAACADKLQAEKQPRPCAPKWRAGARFFCARQQGKGTRYPPGSEIQM